MSEVVFAKRATLTAQDVFATENAEQRRALIEMMGSERFVRTARARQVDASRWGILLDVPDIPVRFVQVTNRTPEPDGQFKEYIIPVPKTLDTAEAAVAATWRRDVHEFRQLIQRYGWTES